MTVGLRDSTAGCRGRRSRRGRRAWVPLLAWLLAAAAGAADEYDEYAVKAALLYNFTKFVEWPEAAFARGDAPFRICVLGPDPFAERLDRIQSQSTRNRRIQIARYAEAAAPPGDCQILFIGNGVDLRQSAILDGLRGKPVLTVGESPEFVSAGGVIALIRQGDRVGFEVNAAAAAAASLGISSQLLKIARRVVQ